MLDKPINPNAPDIHIDIETLVAQHGNNQMPLRTFNISGKPYECLCDTGACTTVLQRPFPDMQMSAKVVWVRSASGHVTQNRMTKPTRIEDPETGKVVKIPILIDLSCPTNLVGRDLMTKLGLAVIPTKGGMKCVDMPEVNLRQGSGIPNYYWTLDLNIGGARDLMKQLEGQLPTKSKVTIKKPTEAHCTLRYKREPGPDKHYDDQIHKLRETSIQLTHLYMTPEGNTVCAVQLNPEQQKLFRGIDRPHVSCAKIFSAEWRQLGFFLKDAERDAYGPPDSQGWSTGQGGYRRKTLGWRVRTTPATHLHAQD